MAHHGSPRSGRRSRSTKSTWPWFAHLGVFLSAQVAFAATGYSWALAFMQDSVPDDPSWLMDVSRIWLIVFAVDTVWTWWRFLSRRSNDSESDHIDDELLIG